MPTALLYYGLYDDYKLPRETISKPKGINIRKRGFFLHSEIN